MNNYNLKEENTKWGRLFTLALVLSFVGYIGLVMLLATYLRMLG